MLKKIGRRRECAALICCNIVAWLALAATALAPAPSSAQSPDVTIIRKDGVQFVDIPQTKRDCPEIPVDAGLRQRIIDAAATEWAAFNFPRFALTPLKRYNVLPPGISPDATRARVRDALVARLSPIGWMEDDAKVRQRIGAYWASVPWDEAQVVFGDQNDIWKSSGGRAGWAQYWSAAFVSFVMCKSGLSMQQFARAGSHLAYIAPAVDQRDGKRQDYAYTAYDLAEATPQPGDLICAARDDDDYAIDNLQAFRTNPRHRSYHCDIVVGFDQPGRKAGVLYGIGGNVVNAVSLTETPISKGALRKVRSPYGRNWFTILKLHAPGTADFRKVPNAVLDAAAAAAKQWQVQ